MSKSSQSLRNRQKANSHVDSSKEVKTDAPNENQDSMLNKIYEELLASKKYNQQLEQRVSKMEEATETKFQDELKSVKNEMTKFSDVLGKISKSHDTDYEEIQKRMKIVEDKLDDVEEHMDIDMPLSDTVKEHSGLLKEVQEKLDKESGSLRTKIADVDKSLMENDEFMAEWEREQSLIDERYDRELERMRKQLRAFGGILDKNSFHNEKQLDDIEKKIKDVEGKMKSSNNTLARMIQQTADMHKKSIIAREKSCHDTSIKVLDQLDKVTDHVDKCRVSHEKELEDVRKLMSDIKLTLGDMAEKTGEGPNKEMIEQMDKIGEMVHKTTSILEDHEQKIEFHRRNLVGMEEKIDNFVRDQKKEISTDLDGIRKQISGLKKFLEDNEECMMDWVDELNDAGVKVADEVKIVQSQLKEIQKGCKESVNKIKILEDTAKYGIPRLTITRSNFCPKKKQTKVAKDVVEDKAQQRLRKLQPASIPQRSQTSSPSKPKCVFCGRENHESTNCFSFINWFERSNVLKERAICRKCLKPEKALDHHVTCSEKDIVCNICVPVTSNSEYSPKMSHNPLLCSVYPCLS